MATPAGSIVMNLEPRFRLIDVPASRTTLMPALTSMFIRRLGESRCSGWHPIHGMRRFGLQLAWSPSTLQVLVAIDTGYAVCLDGRQVAESFLSCS